MTHQIKISVFCMAAAAMACGGAAEDPGSPPEPAIATTAPEPGEEDYLTNLQQLTFEGQNAEAYFSPDDEQLIFQSTPDSLGCDQIFTMRIDGSEKRMVSTGEGVTTCSYFAYPQGDWILFSSTHLAETACPPRPDFSQGYVWAVDPGFDVFTAQPDGTQLERLTDVPGYDAEATFSRDGSKIVFTSVRDGDLEIYTMNADGSDVERLTHEEGYDGGPFFSYDGQRIVYRAHHPVEEEELADYRALLADNLVRPSVMELWVMNADGSDKRQITDNGAANFGPYFFPDGERIIFASNMHDPEGRNFDLYAINVDGTGLARITTHPDFDGFPMFNSDGSKLVWASNRDNAKPGDTNVFVADWVSP